MSRRFKTLILFLVLATMSLRGMAAVDMWHCAHGKSDAIFVTADLHASQPGMHHESAPAHTDAAQHAGHDAPASDDAPGDKAHQMASHCITGAAAPAEQTAFSFAPAGASRIPFVERRMVVVVPAQLERPPLAQSL